MSRKQSAGSVSWGCGSVRWGKIFQYQCHAGWIVLVAAAIITGISHFFVPPNVRPLRIYDATIALPNHPDTVSIELAGIIPFVAMVVTVLAVEFVALWRRQSLTMAIHAVCHIIWWGIIGFAVVLCITEATKPFASRYRPDYLSRCQVRGATDNKTVLVFKQQGECDKAQMDTDFVKDGRKSFPSGHSSNSMSLCWFTVLYFVHALYWRGGLKYMRSISKGGCGRRFLGEVLQGLFIVWGLAVLSIAWCIGVTRFRDNRHNIDDILGGFVVSLLWMTPCTFIALGQLQYFQQRLQEDEGELPLTDAGGSKSPTDMGVAYQQQQQPVLTAPGQASPPVVYTEQVSSPYHTPGAAAAAADPRPAHLATLTSDVGVTPVADANGLPRKGRF